jgi:hypothetical protein
MTVLTRVPCLGRRAEEAQRTGILILLEKILDENRGLDRVRDLYSVRTFQERRHPLSTPVIVRSRPRLGLLQRLDNWFATKLDTTEEITARCEHCKKLGLRSRMHAENQQWYCSSLTCVEELIHRIGLD